MISCMLFVHFSVLSFDFTILPEWQLLPSTQQQIKYSGGKALITALIMYKNRTLEHQSLSAMTFHWNGKKLTSLHASLYHKRATTSYLPTEKYLLGDGIWDPQKQLLQFTFKEPYKLNPVDQFYLVFILPDSKQAIIKDGFFATETQFIATHSTYIISKNIVSWN